MTIITQTMKKPQNTRSHIYGKRKGCKMIEKRTKRGKRKDSLKIMKKEEKLEMMLFLALQIIPDPNPCVTGCNDLGIEQLTVVGGSPREPILSKMTIKVPLTSFHI